MLDDAAAAVGAGSIIPLTGKDRTPTALPRPLIHDVKQHTGRGLGAPAFLRRSLGR